MHLLFYSPQTLPSIGGLQYVVHYWAEALCRRGHQVTIISETPALADPLPHEPAAAPAAYTIFRNISFSKQVAAMRAADSIILFNVSLKALPACLLSGRPLYVSHHTALWYDGGPRRWQQRMKQWVANRLAKDNCACSAYIGALYRQCRVIYSPYRADVFVPGTQPRRPRTLLFAGRLVSDKGADLLIAALHRLQHETEPLTLLIAGDGPDRALLQQQAQRLGIPVAAGMPPQQATPADTTRIFFTGALPQPALVHLMQTTAIMVVPSRMEPMGMVVAEGLACGACMVVSRQGGMPEVGGSFCHYFESNNAISLAAALYEALHHPLQPDAEALRRHLQQFTIPYAVDRLEAWLTGEA